MTWTGDDQAIRRACSARVGPDDHQRSKTRSPRISRNPSTRPLGRADSDRDPDMAARFGFPAFRPEPRCGRSA